MEISRVKGLRTGSSLFQTGYPQPINFFVALMVVLLPTLTPLAEGTGSGRSVFSYALGGALAVIYLLVWTRIRATNPERSTRFYQTYLFVQTLAVATIYVLDGGLTRFLFVVVAVQAAYVSPVRRWAPFLGTVGALWLTIYLVISPQEVGANQVAIIGLYLCYLIFAALVTFTTVQQERQVDLAQQLLESVDNRHNVLRIYNLSLEELSEVEERDRLARTIHQSLVDRLTGVVDEINLLFQSSEALDTLSARRIRLSAKEALNEIRNAVRTLRPSLEEEQEGDNDDLFSRDGPADHSIRATDPIRIYHVWNLGIIIVTVGVMVAAHLVGRNPDWLRLLGMGLALVMAYGATAFANRQWIKTLGLVLQAGLCLLTIELAQEPLTNHLIMIVAAQIVFLVPTLTRWLVAAVVFPILLCAIALWQSDLYVRDWTLAVTLLAAFGVTYFFSAVMAYMTRRQLEARQQAVAYTQQMEQVNRLLEAKLQQVRRMGVARARVSMAREIHDSLGHHMTAAIVDLQYVEELVGEDSLAVERHLRSARSVLIAAVESSTELGYAFERFDRPLGDALSELVSAWRGSQHVDVKLSVSGDLASLSPAARVTLYRVVQESLTNIHKHARARMVRITVVRQTDRVSLSIRNDDTGAQPQSEAESGGYGLVGLRERADVLQGEFWAGKRVDGGFEVTLVLPLGA